VAGGDCGVERPVAAGSPAGVGGANGGERDPATGDLTQGPAKEGGKRRRGRKDALGNTSQERVEAQGCPHCAGCEVIGWGRSHELSRFRCKSCGRTFNALTKTPMAHLRKKERWLDHVRAMIEGKSLAKTAQLCGVDPTTASRWHHPFPRASASDKPRSFRGIVEADEIFVLGPTCLARRANEAERQGIPAFIRTAFPSASPATAKARLSTRSCLRLTTLR
jgi:transposase-like protein